MSLKTDKDDDNGPGPVYNTESCLTIKSTIDKTESKKDSSIGHKYDSYEKTMYRG